MDPSDAPGALDDGAAAGARGGSVSAQLSRVVHDLSLQAASGALLSTAALLLVAVFAALRGAAAWARARAVVVYSLDEESVEHEWVAAWLAATPEARRSGAKQLVAGDSDDEEESADRGSGGGLALRTTDGDTLTLRTRLLPGASLLLHVKEPPGKRVWVQRATAAAASGRSGALCLHMLRPGAERAVNAILARGRALHMAQRSRRMRLYEAVQLSDGLEWEWSRTPPGPRALALADVVPPTGAPDAPRTLLADVVRYLDSEQWYASRGIPYHRGYLLHGPSGCGKTTLVHAVAGALRLRVFAVDLCAPQLADAALADLFCGVSSRSMVLLEHVDRAFDAQRARLRGGGAGAAAATGTAAGLTFSGLLNVLDGVHATHGCIIFFTSDVPPAALDPALVRPGRCDYALEVKHADAEAAEALFRAFYARHPFHELPAEELEAAARAFGRALRDSGRTATLRHRDVVSFLSTRSPRAAVDGAALVGLDAQDAAAAQAAPGVGGPSGTAK